MSIQSLRGVFPSALIPMAAYYVVAAGALALTQGMDGIATVWPASGVLLTALLMVRPSYWPALLTACSVASLAANLQTGNTVLVSSGFTVANMVEGLLGAGILLKWCGGTPSFSVPYHVARFFVVGIVAAVTSASIAGYVSNFPLFWPWFTSDLAGILVVPPVALTIAQISPADRTMVAIRRLLIDIAALGAVTTIVFSQDRYPILFLPLAALLAVAYRRGTIGAAVGVLCIAFIGSLATALGHGPLGLIRHGPVEQALFFQFYLLILFALAVPAGTLFSSRRLLLLEVEERERRYRLLADNSNDMVELVSVGGNREYISPACRLVLGYDPEELIGRSSTADVHPDDCRQLLEVRRSILHDNQARSCTFRQRRKDGSYVWLEATHRLVPNTGPTTSNRVVVSTRDVTRRVASEAARESAALAANEANRLLSMAERIAHVGHWRLDLAIDQIFWSPEVFKLHGISGDKAPSLEGAVAFYHEDDLERVQTLITAGLQEGKGFEFEARIIRGDGEIRHVFSKGEPEFGSDGALTALFGVVQDVTRRAQAEFALAEALDCAQRAAREAIALVEIDQLTGAASRRHTIAFLEDQIRTANRDGLPLSVAMFDIDHFKSVNDRFGHDVGDQVLTRVVEQAASVVRRSDLVGRLGGEEFVVILPSADASFALDVAERLRLVVERGDPEGISVTISMGVAQLRPNMDARELLRDADGALYAAKRAGRNILKLAA